MMTKVENDIKSLSFEQGMVELESLVAKLESRDIGLEESLAAYERGHVLQQHLAGILQHTEMRIEKIGQAAHQAVAKPISSPKADASLAMPQPDLGLSADEG